MKRLINAPFIDQDVRQSNLAKSTEDKEKRYVRQQRAHGALSAGRSECMREGYYIIRTNEKHRPCGGNLETVQARLRKIINEPFDIDKLELTEESRHRIHQELVQAFAVKSNEVPAYAAIREWLLLNQRIRRSGRSRVRHQRSRQEK